jgi:hypothetical protein
LAWTPGLVKRRGRRSGGLGGKQFLGDLIERPAVNAFAFPADGNDGEVWPNLLLEYAPGHAQVGGGLTDANDARRKAVFHFLSWFQWRLSSSSMGRISTPAGPSSVQGQTEFGDGRCDSPFICTDWFHDLSRPAKNSSSGPDTFRK